MNAQAKAMEATHALADRIRGIGARVRAGFRRTAKETADATADATKVGLASNGVVLGAWLFVVWAAGLVWAIVCAVGSATANVHFYKSLAITPFDAAVLTAIGVAFECGLVALLPISERVKRAGDPSTAKKLRGFWSACLVASFVAALGFYAVALWEAQAPKATADRLQALTTEEVVEAKRELDTIDKPVPPRAVAELDGLIAASLARPAIDRDGQPRRISLERATNGCAPGTGGRAFRDQCPEVLELRAERARAVRKTDLQAKLKTNRETLKTAKVETTAGVHPLFGIIARVTKADGAIVQLAFLVLISALTVASAGFGPHLLLDALGAVRRARKPEAKAAEGGINAKAAGDPAGARGDPAGADPATQTSAQAAGAGSTADPSAADPGAADPIADPIADPVDPVIDPDADPVADPSADPIADPAIGADADPVSTAGTQMTFTPSGASPANDPAAAPLSGAASAWSGRLQRARARFGLGGS